MRFILVWAFHVGVDACIIFSVEAPFVEKLHFGRIFRRIHGLDDGGKTLGLWMAVCPMDLIDGV